MVQDLLTGGASVEDVLALWAASLREAKQRIRPLFTQDRVAASAGRFLDALLGNEPRKTGGGAKVPAMRSMVGNAPEGGCGRRQRATVGLGGSKPCWAERKGSDDAKHHWNAAEGAGDGMPMRCAILSVTTLSSIWASRMRSW